MNKPHTQQAPVPPVRTPPTATATASASAWFTRALFPKVMEFKVISREREKHEFMPVVYLLDRSASWKKRVPRAIETQLIEDYIAPLLPIHVGNSTEPTSATAFSKEDLEMIERELHQRTELLARAATEEVPYKMALLVNYAATPTLHKSELFTVVRRLLTTLTRASHRRALLVPVSLHFCTDGSVWNVRRHAGIRYGSPVLVEKRDVEIFQEDPLEYVHHVTAKLQASLKMQPPQSAAQMEILRLSRSLHVYCARVSRDDCFSRRQIASMNEEILQIHFRTRNHPDMHVLKTKMQQYCTRLSKWRLRDEDINAATVAGGDGTATTTSATQIASFLVAMLLQLGATPWRLLLAGIGDFVFCPATEKQTRTKIVALGAAILKCIVAVALCSLLVYVALMASAHWLSVACVLLLLALHAASSSVSLGRGKPEQNAHSVAMIANWKQIQFYMMDASELRELKEMRAVLARRIHALVAQYVSADLPPPVLQSPLSLSRQTSSSSSNAADVETRDQDQHDQHDHDPQIATRALNQYSLNPHHKIFINAPRSFPLEFAQDRVQDAMTARRAVYAPKMLRDEVWRSIYGTLAPPSLQFAELLADNKGDALPMERLLSTTMFNAVLTAYVLYQKRSRTHSGSDDGSANADAMASDLSSLPSWQIEDVIAENETAGHSSDGSNSLGRFTSVREIVEAALELAQEEDELSS